MQLNTWNKITQSMLLVAIDFLQISIKTNRTPLNKLNIYIPYNKVEDRYMYTGFKELFWLEISRLKKTHNHHFLY